MQVNMHEAKSQLSKLVQAVLDGEEVIIARNGIPAVRITKYAAKKATRKPGAWKGKMWLADDWDSPKTNMLVADMMMRSTIFPAEPEGDSVQEPAKPYGSSTRKPVASNAGKRRGK